MDPKIIVIIAVSYLYGFIEVFMNLRQRRKNNAITTNDKGSLWLLYGRSKPKAGEPTVRTTVAWLSLDEGDNYLSRFIAYLAEPSVSSRMRAR